MNNNPWPTFKTIALKAIKLVNSNPKLVILSLLIALASFFGSALNLLPLLIIIMVGSYVWNFVQIDLLKQHQAKQAIDWKKVPALFLKYFKKSWLLMLITVIFLYGVGFAFFFISKVGTFDSLLNNSAAGSIFGSLLNISTTIISLWFVQTVILVVLKDRKILKALPESGVIIYQNATFFIILTLILEILGLVVRYLFQILPENAIIQLAFLSYNAYLTLLTSAIVLTKFSKTEK